MTDMPYFPSDDAILTTDELAAKLLHRFQERLHDVDWFSALGEPVNSQDRGFAPSYLDAMGFADCMVHYIHSWEEAEEAAAAISVESPWWMEENRLFEEAMQQAADKLGEATVTQSLQAIAGEMNLMVPQQLTDYAREGGYMDDALIDGAFGMAVRHTQMACAMLLAGTFDEGHAFTQLFNIYEIGHWPIGLVGRSFVVF
jgi:hypothetical protein